MEIKKCIIKNFSVIGRLGSTNDEAGFINRLWREANTKFDEISGLVKRNDDNNIYGMWGLMSDFSLKFLPWEDGFSKGLYLAGIEVEENSFPPEGWVKWDIPQRDYLYIEVDSSNYQEAFETMVSYTINNMGYDLIGAANDYTDFKTGKNYIYFPIKERTSSIKLD